MLPVLLGSIHISDLLGLNYCMNYLLNNGLYCTKWANSSLLFDEILWELKIVGCAHFLRLPGLKCSHNSSGLINHKCEWLIK